MVAEGNRSATKLAEAVRLSEETLARHRTARRGYVVQYAGPYYAKDAGLMAVSAAATGPEPVNALFSMVATFVPQLVMQAPRAQIGSQMGFGRAAGRVLAGRMDQLTGEIDLATTLRRATVDSMFGMGIVKTGVTAGVRQRGGYMHDEMQPFADCIDLDDYVVDVTARVREQAWFEGHRFRLPKRQVVEGGFYDRALAEKLTPRAGGPARVAEVGPGQTALSRGADLEEIVELIELWLPGEGVVVTIAADGGAEGYLSEVQWEGPETGPLDVLGYHWVPGNLLPVAPIGILYDLHCLINKQARKLGRQADRQKDLILYNKRVGDEAQAVKDAMDGGMVGVEDPKNYQQVSQGGVNDKGFQNLAYLEREFSRIGGNLDLMSGLAAQSPTLGQDEVLQANTDIRLRDMRVQVYGFVKSVMKKLAWYLWNVQPPEDAPAQERLPRVVPVMMDDGTELEYPWNVAEWRERGVEFEDMAFDVDPYSMVPQSPEQKLRRLVEWLNVLVLPTAQIGAAQGAMLNVPALVARAARLGGIEGMSDLYRMMAPMQQVGGMASAAAPVGRPSAPAGGGARQAARPQRAPQRSNVEAAA